MRELNAGGERTENGGQRGATMAAASKILTAFKPVPGPQVPHQVFVPHLPGVIPRRYSCDTCCESVCYPFDAWTGIWGALDGVRDSKGGRRAPYLCLFQQTGHDSRLYDWMKRVGLDGLAWIFG